MEIIVRQVFIFYTLKHFDFYKVRRLIFNQAITKKNQILVSDKLIFNYIVELKIFTKMFRSEPIASVLS